MINGLIWFCIRGYIVPAAFFAANIWEADRKSDDRPSVAESILTAIVGGAVWPFATHHAEPRR